MNFTTAELDHQERIARHRDGVAALQLNRPSTLAECAEALVALYEQNWNADAFQINCGDCDAFAMELIQIWTGEDRETDDAVVLWGEDLEDDEDRSEDIAGLHACAKIEGRYYDSECPEGEDDWRALPCFARYFGRVLKAQPHTA